MALRLRDPRRFALLYVQPFTSLRSSEPSGWLPCSASASAITASADFSLRRGGLQSDVALSSTNEISPGKDIDLHRTTAGYTPPRFDHEGFAIFSPLALFDSASNPISVRRPTASLLASSRRFLAVPPLRFTSVTVVNFRKDFHLQVDAHAGRTERNRADAVAEECYAQRFSANHRCPSHTSSPRDASYPERSGSEKTSHDEPFAHGSSRCRGHCALSTAKLHGYTYALHTRSTGAHVDLPLGSTGDGVELSSGASVR